MQISFTFHPYGFPLTFNTDFSDLQHRFHLLSIQIPILAAQICFTFNIDFLYFQCRFPLLAVQISLTFNTDFLYFPVQISFQNIFQLLIDSKRSKISKCIAIQIEHNILGASTKLKNYKTLTHTTTTTQLKR